MPTILIRRLVLAAASCAALAGGATPSLARTRHHATAARHHAAAQGHAAPASHAEIPQNANIENLNDLSLRRARAGESTSRPLAPPLAQ